MTTDPSAATVGSHSAVLTATGAGTAIRTAVGATLEPEQYDIAIDTTPRDGETFGGAAASWLNIDTGDWDFISGWDEQGDTVLRLVPGRYKVIGYVDGIDETPTTTAFATDVVLAGDGQTVTWDAGAGQHDDIAIGRSDVDIEDHLSSMQANDVGLTSVIAVITGLPAGGEFYTVPSEPMFGEFVYAHTAVFSGPDYVYNLAKSERDRLPAGSAHSPRDEELAIEKVRYHSQGVTATAERAGRWVQPEGGIGMPGLLRPQKLPGERTEYFTPAQWNGILMFTAPVSGYEDYASRSSRREQGTTSFDDANPEVLNQFSTFDGPVGQSTLSFGGQQIAMSDTCRIAGDLPAGAEGTATFTCRAERDVPWSVLATESGAQWTFATEPGPAGERTFPTLSAIRLSSPSIVDGFAPAGKRQHLAIDVYEQFQSAPTATRRLTFEVSYDDGKTWAKVPVHRTGDHATATLKHPKGAAFVSTRLSAVDELGNSVTQTTIRSYGLG